MILDQRERAEVQAGRQRNPVDAGVERRPHAHAQRFLRRVHRQLFHDIDEDESGAALGLHRFADVQAGRLGQLPEIELDQGLVDVGDVELELLQFLFDELGVEAPVGNRIDHRVGDMADSAQTSRLQRQSGSRDIDAHATDHDRHELSLAEHQTEIIYTHSQYPSTTTFRPESATGVSR